MTLPELLPVLAIHLYALGTVAIVTGILARRSWLKRAALWLTGAAFVAHTLLLGNTLMLHGISALPRSAYTLLLAWCIALGGLLAWIRFHYESLLLVVSPVTLIFFLVSLLLRHTSAPLPGSLSGMTLSIHIGALFISIGLMALAFGAGLIFLFQERTIKSKNKMTGFQKDFPALSVLDRINSFTVTLGFPLFTIGILFGFISARLSWGSILTGDPKELVSLLVWILYAWLFRQRFSQGMQGHRPAQMAIVVFVFCALSMLVVNLTIPSHHNF